jgi:rSAM/selenodomain-associated transferase 1
MKLTALAIMAKVPQVGRTKTRLCPPLTPEQAAALYEAMLKDSIDLVAGMEGFELVIAGTPSDGMSYFKPMSPPQALILPVDCDHIGECLDKVLTQLMYRGHPKALAFNSDGPSLPSKYFHDAAELLDTVDLVVGPSTDGGYYLIGIKHPQPQLFYKIHWSTSVVCSQTLALAEGSGLQTALLDPWYDVDDINSLHRLRDELNHLPKRRLVHTRGLLSQIYPLSIE